jgi:Velvet factor
MHPNTASQAAYHAGQAAESSASYHAYPQDSPSYPSGYPSYNHHHGSHFHPLYHHHPSDQYGSSGTAQSHHMYQPTHSDDYPAQPTQGGQFTRNLIGSLTASAFRLKDDKKELGIWFILQDLSVRTEGKFRLKFNFFNLARYHSYGVKFDGKQYFRSWGTSTRKHLTPQGLFEMSCQRPFRCLPGL